MDIFCYCSCNSSSISLDMEYEVIWWFVMSVLSLLGFKLGWDYYQRFEKQREINHLRSAIIDGILYTVSASLILWIYGPFQWWDVIGFVMLAGATRWIIFDPAFSLLSGTGFHHHGESSKLDQWLLQVGKGHFCIKLIPVALGLLIIFI